MKTFASLLAIALLLGACAQSRDEAPVADPVNGVLGAAVNSLAAAFETPGAAFVAPDVAGIRLGDRIDTAIAQLKERGFVENGLLGEDMVVFSKAFNEVLPAGRIFTMENPHQILALESDGSQVSKITLTGFEPDLSQAGAEVLVDCRLAGQAGGGFDLGADGCRFDLTDGGASSYEAKTFHAAGSLLNAPVDGYRLELSKGRV